MEANWSLWLWWTFLNLISIIILGFYSMTEMACVSLNKIRLRYYVEKGVNRARWLDYLIQHPIRLFGTTLLAVNMAMFIGSECARQSYIALGLSADLAPLTQVVIVIVIAELAPMFAARRYAEHVALLGAPILYASAKLMIPILWIIKWIAKLIDFTFGTGTVLEGVSFNQEDLQKILAVQSEEREEADEFDLVTRNIFRLSNKTAIQMMHPIDPQLLLSTSSLVSEAFPILLRSNVKSIQLYHRDPRHIVGVVYPNSLLQAPANRLIREFANSPWFITQNASAYRILQDFRRSSRNEAVVLSDNGVAIGILNIENLVEEIFGITNKTKSAEASNKLLFLERTFSGKLTVGEFNEQFDVILSEEVLLTLSELMEKALEHLPEEGEMVYLPPFELIAKKVSIREVETVEITTRIT